MASREWNAKALAPVAVAALFFFSVHSAPLFWHAPLLPTQRYAVAGIIGVAA